MQSASCCLCCAAAHQYHDSLKGPVVASPYVETLSWMADVCEWGAGYLAHGTATDYMYDRLKVPLSLTWEIYGDNDAHFNDCFRMFNPTTREKFDEVTLSSSMLHCFYPKSQVQILQSVPALPSVNLCAFHYLAAEQGRE